MLCKNCGSNELHDSGASGNLTCFNCGAVAAINRESVEVEYVEEAGGNKAIGKFYSEYHKSEGLAIRTAKLRIDTLCDVMNIPILLDRASNFYITALRRGITRGRPRDEVVCACIYLAYRTTTNPQFSLSLLDFSDHVEINVFRLGHTYLSLKQRLHVENIHDIDPYLFVEPFARQLEFGEHTMNVCETAALILRRMRKDWICTGRRPAGIAAASLLVAARIHQFDRTYEDISKIARISQNTTRKRLIEFFSTDVADETLDNIHTINSFESEHDPPCFKEGQRRSMELTQLDKSDEEITMEIHELEQRINSELEKLQSRSVLPLKKYLGLIKDSDETTTTTSLGGAANATSPTSNQIYSSDFIPSKRARIDLDGACSSDFVGTSSSTPPPADENVDDDDRQRAMDVLCGKDLNDVDESLLRHTLLGVVKADELDEHVRDLSHVIDDKTFAQLNEQLNEETLQEIMNSCKNMPGSSNDQQPFVFEREDQQLDLTGIDDEELEREYILNKSESVAKIRVWLKDNSDYLVEEKRRQEVKKKKLDEASETKKKRKPSQRVADIKGKSPGEMLRKAMEIRKMPISLDYNTLINMDGLEDLGNSKELNATCEVGKTITTTTSTTTTTTMDEKIFSENVKSSRKVSDKIKPRAKSIKIKNNISVIQEVSATPVSKETTKNSKEEVKIVQEDNDNDHIMSEESLDDEDDYHRRDAMEDFDYDHEMPFTEDFL